MRFSRLSLTIVALHAPFLAHAQSGPAGIVRGTVTSRERDIPIENAQIGVIARSERATTDGSGRYSLSLAPGTYRLVFRAVGTRPDTQTVTVTVATPVRRDVRLERVATQLAATVVTAQKRTQDVQDVPIAIAAFDASFLRNASIQQFDELAYYVPNMNLQLQSPNNPSFSIRGITSDDGSSQIEPRVSVFADGVPMSKSRGSVVELFDMERIEVLKGPQGTLFGRGAQIGAIHLIQHKPDNETSATLRVGSGSYAEQYAQGTINTPLVADKLLFRAAAIRSARDGFITNLSGGNLLGKETTAARVSLRWLPTQRTVVDVIGNWQDDTPPGAAFKSGTFAPAGGTTNPNTFADLEEGEALGIDRRIYNASLLVTQRFSDAWQLRNISAYRRFDSNERFDADGTAAPALRFNEIARGDQYSSEFRLEFDRGGRFAGFGGVNFFRETGFQKVPFNPDERSLWALISPTALNAIPAALRPLVAPLFPAGFVVNGVPVLPENLPNIPGTPFQGQLLKTNHFEQSENFGELNAAEVFLDGSLQLNRMLSVTAGVRGTRESVNNALFIDEADTPGTLGAFIGGGTNNLFRPTNGRRTGTGEFNSWVGRAIVKFTPDPRLQSYASVSRGRRPNIVQLQFNGTAGEYLPVTLNDETVISYEAGLKGTGVNGRMNFDVAVFRYDYENFQTQAVNPNAAQPGQQLFITRDDGSAGATGVESSIRGQFTRALSGFATWGYLDAEFDATNSSGNAQRLAGNRFRLAPRHTYSLGATYSARASNGAGLDITPTWLWRGQHFFEETNLPAVQQEAYGLANLRTVVTMPGGRIDVTGIVRNALDRKFIIDAGNTGGAFGIPTFIAGPPRIISVQLGYTF